ncbi:DNA-binding response regulator [Paenibacillus antibioticophila]|uniref:DNA-binding response regulator n=1 Tax=Paenibacillus antibioticophila TaxID=1274374 RepID=A0A919XRW2_9BACL|nr:response regulator transcription factor [Paenibacillus antibioticophila]GIO35330.1 DNA-binding response regulator [Paenibacillus antibioticophila]
MPAEKIMKRAVLQNGNITPIRRPQEPVFEAPTDGEVMMCPVTQRVILVSPYPSGIHELVRDLSEDCFDVLVFHHWDQGIRNAQSADLLIFDLTPVRSREEISKVQALLQEAGGVPSMLLVSEALLLQFSKEMPNQELLIWPSRSGEVTYRARRIMRTTTQRSDSSRLLSGSATAIYKDLWIDRKKMSVYKDGKILELTKTEYELLTKLIEREGAVLSREDLLTEVWGTTFMGGSNIVDVHIKSLRKKLGDRAVNSLYIVTVRGVGYRLAD